MTHNIVIFDWKGMFAHFRQFDANSSSLSYSFPPPTVITGMIAGLFGIERDEYYKLFGKRFLELTVQLLTPPRKIMQTVNYIYATQASHLNMSAPNVHTQIPMEFVISPHFPHEPVTYRIFLKFTDGEFGQELEKVITQKLMKYLPYFGSAPFTSWIEWLGAPEEIEVFESDKPLKVDSVVPITAISSDSLSLNLTADSPPAYFREHMRREFKPGREPGEIIDLIWERNHSKIQAAFNSPIYRLKLHGEDLNIIFY